MNIIKKRILLVISLIILIIFFDNYKIPCIIHEVTGLKCPGCGMTRSMLSFINFDIINGLKYNLLSIILIYLIIYFFIYGNLNINKKIANIILIITIIYTIIRNI